jgi:membrane fusion protein, multidrug efflux system
VNDPNSPNSAPSDLGFVLPPPTRLSLGKALWIGVISLLLLGAIFIAAYLPRQRAQAALNRAAEANRSALPTVAVITPKLIASERSLKLPGSVQPLEEAVIHARANGYVNRWLVDLGARVEAGQLLAELDTPELDQELGQARAALAQATAAKLQAEANKTLAQSVFDRNGKLVQAGIASQAELDQSAAQAASGDATVRVAEAAIQAQQANIRRLNDLKAFASVRAPFAGTVTERNIDRGSLVTAGNGTALFKISATQTVRVFVQVPQDVASAVKINTPAKVVVREFGELPFPGTVAHTAGALDATTRTLNTEIRVDNRDGRLLSGMYAEVNLALDAPRQVYDLPATVLLNDAAGLRVAVVRPDDTIHLQPIVLDRDLGATLHVSSGITADDRVVQIGTADLLEGQRVSVALPKPAP